MEAFDWDRAIIRNREALQRIVAALAAMTGLTDGVETLPRHLRNAACRILRPAESAVRRLVLIAARNIEVVVREATGARQRRAADSGLPLTNRSCEELEGGTEKQRDVSSAKREGPGDFDGLAERNATAKRQKSQERRSSQLSICLRPGRVPAACGSVPALAGLSPCHRHDEFASANRLLTPQGARYAAPAFPILDPLKDPLRPPPRRRAKTMPMITCFENGYRPWGPVPEIKPPMPDDEMDARPLTRRLETLQRALADIDGYARKLARWRARRDFRCKRPDGELPAADPGRGPRWVILRPGWPPGYHKRQKHEIDEVLLECHRLVTMQERETVP